MGEPFTESGRLRRWLATLLLILTLPGAAAEGKTEQARHVETPDGSRIEVTYPQLVGGDAALRNQVNGNLRAAFIPEAGEVCGDLEPDEVAVWELDARVKLDRRGLLSVFGRGLGMRNARDGTPRQAHPTKLFRSITLDLEHGKVYALDELFRPGYRDTLDRLIRADLKSRAIPLEEDVAGHTYGYYLSPEGLALYEISTSFAAADLMVVIPYARLKAIAAQSGPLARFLR